MKNVCASTTEYNQQLKIPILDRLSCLILELVENSLRNSFQNMVKFYYLHLEASEKASGSIPRT
jgi:hypothetical protein